MRFIKALNIINGGRQIVVPKGTAMKRLISVFMAIVVGAMTVQAQAKEKVILDSDMVEIFDDGFAMVLLQLAPNVELLGVTTVVGNSWVAEGTA